jgi:hypothetical protein
MRYFSLFIFFIYGEKRSGRSAGLLKFLLFYLLTLSMDLALLATSSTLISQKASGSRHLLRGTMRRSPWERRSSAARSLQVPEV